MAARHFVISIHIKAIRSIILNISSEIGALLDSVRKKNGVLRQTVNSNYHAKVVFGNTLMLE